MNQLGGSTFEVIYTLTQAIWVSRIGIDLQIPALYVFQNQSCVADCISFDSQLRRRYDEMDTH
jgi:hypothetical protein